MQLDGIKLRVRLIVDLTRYDPRCKKGLLGWTIPNTRIDIIGAMDTFVAVRFDDGPRMDVLWKSLEILKE